MLLYDCIDPKTGQTFREGNLATEHSVPLGAKVAVSNVVLTAFFSDEINIPGPIQLLVVGHTRDCDGTPLYILSDIPVRPLRPTSVRRRSGSTSTASRRGAGIVNVAATGGMKPRPGPSPRRPRGRA